MRRLSAVFSLAALAAAVCLGQGEALRAPRPDVSLGGEPSVGAELGLGLHGTVGAYSTNWPWQGLDFTVWEDIREATFLAWMRVENVTARAAMAFATRPILRGRAPCRMFLHVARGVGSVVFEGYSEACEVDSSVCYNLSCDGEVVVDFGGGAVTNAPGRHLNVIARGVRGGDVSVTAGTNTVWSLHAGVPRVRRGVGMMSGADIFLDRERNEAADDWFAAVCRVDVPTNGTLRVRYTFFGDDGGVMGEGQITDPGGTIALPDGDSVLRGPNRVMPFLSFGHYGADGSYVDEAVGKATLWVWGKKLWRRLLTDEEVNAVILTDVEALRGRGVVGAAGGEGS